MKEAIISSILFFIPPSFIERVAFADVRNISGRVIGFDDSLPIEGVAVFVKGSAKSTGTQVDGNFYIRVNHPKDSVLMLSHSGYKTQELKLTRKNDYEVVLERAGN